MSALALALLLRPGLALAEEPGSKALSHDPGAAEYARLASERRRALVVGESAYKHAPNLPGAAHDVDLVSRALTAAGFSVTTLRNTTKRDFERAAVQFAYDTREGDVVLIYWSGHGVQRDGRNWLIPVDADLPQPARLSSDAVNLDSLIDQLSTKHARLSMVLLDACRNNPWEKSWAATGKGLEEEGLAEPQATPTDFLIAFATAPEHTAMDGGDKAGPYAQALAREMAGTEELQQVLQAVRADVAQWTNAAQQPWVTQSIGPGHFFFTMPSEEEFLRRYGAPSYGKIAIAVRMKGVLTVDGEVVGHLTNGASLIQQTLTGEHRVCLDRVCQEVVVAPNTQSSIVLAPPPPPVRTRVHHEPRWVLIGAGGASLVAAGGLEVWARSAAADWHDCAGADVVACSKDYRSDAQRAWYGETAWDDLPPQQQLAEVLQAGLAQTSRTNHLATASAVGAALLGAGLVTVGIVW